MRILYLSCHEVLEHDEVSMLHELGHYVFSPGAYVEPRNRGDGCLRPSIPGLEYDPDDLDQYHQLCHGAKDGKERLTREFCQRFDAIVVMHIPRWIQNNWDAFRGKPVIWRTIGQCLPHQELAMRPYRDRGMRIVRYSPREEQLEHYAGCDAMIRFAKDPEIYRGWTGERQAVVNFTQSMPERSDACNYPLYRQVMWGFPAELYGPSNEDAKPFTRGKVTHDEQLSILRSSRCYFYTGTHPASYTLSFIEAWMTGIPIVAIGPYHGNAPFHRRPASVGAPDDGCLYEVARLLAPDLGLVSDDSHELRQYVRHLLDDEQAARELSIQGRKAAIEHFGRPTIKERWKQFFEML